MATNSRLFMRITLVLFLLVSAYPLASQSAGYFVIDADNGHPRFFQRLVWRGGEYALRYEVVIQVEEDGAYVDHLREFTSALFVEVSLPPGEYRFQVIPYDVLDRPGESSEWMTIEVLHALKPELYYTLPEYVLSSTSDELLGYLLNITGYNLDKDAQIILRGSDGTSFIPEAIYSHDNSSIQVFIESDMLTPGEYEIIIRNPGGLEASIGGIAIPPDYQPPAEFVQEPVQKPDSRFFINPLKPMQIKIDAAWIPLMPIYGEDYGGGISFLGLAARASLVFYTPLNIYVGPEVAVSFFLIDSVLLEAGANVLAMKLLSSQRSYLGFRLGAAYTLLPGSLSQLSAVIGVSFHWHLTNMFLLEAGIDYSNLFNDISSGSLRPWIGVGLHL